MLVSGFSDLINISTSLSDLAGYTVRIADLTEVASELKEKILSLRWGIPLYLSACYHVPDSPSFSTDGLTYKADVTPQGNPSSRTNGFGGRLHVGDTIKFDEVTCYTPTGKRLVHNILSQ